MLIVKYYFDSEWCSRAFICSKNADYTNHIYDSYLIDEDTIRIYIKRWCDHCGLTQISFADAYQSSIHDVIIARQKR